METATMNVKQAAQEYSEINPVKAAELFIVSKTGERFDCSITETGKKSHFLRFLENASNFTWRKEDAIITEKERYENTVHLIAKLCAIGYMLTRTEDLPVSRAVVALDMPTLDENSSSRRTGKSLLGELFKRVAPTIYFNGRKSDLSVVDFIREKVHEDTRIVFIDAGRWSYNFEYLFACITPLYDRPPKIYIAEDCTPIGKGSFSITSQWPIVFSDYYGDIHTPYDDFGMMFFFGWDFEQWELTRNLIAQCVKLYSWLGVVESPVELK